MKVGRMAARKTVLVVEDDAAIRALVVKALQSAGYAVEQAADGMAAAELLGTVPRAPDLLVCDVMMPTIDGFSLARLVKSRAELRTMPIIFLTGKAAPADVARGINIGARHYMAKPFSVKDLLERVRKLID
jgi:DNA-binding response OmpR family regulator